MKKDNPQLHEQDAGIQAIADGLAVILKCVKFIILALLIGFAMSGVRNVERFENGVVLRFGAVQGDVREEAGLVFALPYPIDEVITVAAKRTQTIESSAFWYAVTDYEQSTGLVTALPGTLKPGVDGYLITADRNIVHVRTTMKYRIRNTVSYLFAFTHHKDLLKSYLDNVTLKTISAVPIDSVFQEKNQLSLAITGMLQDMADRFELGIDIDPVDLQLAWPRQVSEDINGVIRANQKFQQDIGEAELYANAQESEAESQVSQTTLRARTWATRRTSRVEADAATFTKLYPLFKNNPDVIKQTMYQDRMRRIMDSADQIFIIEGKENREIRLNIPRTTRSANEDESDGE